MNYITQINAFYDWLETNTLSANAVLTWHALMHTNNKCFWKTEFAVAISVLAHKTGGVSRRSIERARNELQQKGLIEWKERTGSQSATYRIIPIVRLCDAQSVVQPVVQPVVQVDVQPVAQPDAITSYPTDTQKTKTKTKQNKTIARAKPPDEIGALVSEYSQDSSVQESIHGYLEMRKAKKKPATARALLSVLRRLDELSGGVDARRIAVLEQSTRNGWTDVYAVKNDEGEVCRNAAHGNPFLSLAEKYREEERTI